VELNHVASGWTWVSISFVICLLSVASVSFEICHGNSFRMAHAAKTQSVTLLKHNHGLYVLVSRHLKDEIVGACSLNVGNKTLDNVAKLKYFGTMVTDLSFV